MHCISRIFYYDFIFPHRERPYTKRVDFTVIPLHKSTLHLYVVFEFSISMPDCNLFAETLDGDATAPSACRPLKTDAWKRMREANRLNECLMLPAFNNSSD